MRRGLSSCLEETVKHKGQVRAGRWQCNACRAAWASAEAAEKSTKPCPGVPLPHGFYRREHLVYPLATEDGHGPDPYCDDTSCPCMRHDCQCDVCTGVIEAPALNILRDNHDGDGALTRFDRAQVVRTVGLQP
jgi:hypothetical protein